MGEISKPNVQYVRKDTYVYPKEIPGYISPEPQLAKFDGQGIDFDYKPIKYNIRYNLNGGILDHDVKNTYTVQESYIPPIPIRDGFKFVGWKPDRIKKGTIGDITFVAGWQPLAILPEGEELNSFIKNKLGLLSGLNYPIYNDIKAIKVVDSLDSNARNIQNISITSTPIFIWYNIESKSVMLNSNEKIVLNYNSRKSFSGFISLIDISGMSSIVCRDNTDIGKMFSGCRSLIDITPLNSWDQCKFKDIFLTLHQTLAVQSGRVPNWYKWNIETVYKSSSGKELDREIISYIPGQIVYPKNINGYRSPQYKIQVLSKDELKLIYDPIEYEIKYNLNGGIIGKHQTYYDIESNTYYPPMPFKDGYTFIKYIPECLEHGDFGGIEFVAIFEKNKIE